MVSKKVSDSVSKILGIEKLSNSVSEKFGIKKKFLIRFWSDFRYRHKLDDDHDGVDDDPPQKCKYAMSDAIAKDLIFSSELQQVFCANLYWEKEWISNIASHWKQ